MGNRRLARNKEVQKILGRRIPQELIAREVVFQAQMTACEAQGSWVASGLRWNTREKSCGGWFRLRYKCVSRKMMLFFYVLCSELACKPCKKFL